MEKTRSVFTWGGGGCSPAGISVAAARAMMMARKGEILIMDLINIEGCRSGREHYLLLRMDRKKPRLPWGNRGFQVLDLRANSLQSLVLIPVMRGLVGPFEGDVEVVGLLLGQLGKLHSDLFEVETGDFLVELLGENVDTWLVGLTVLPEL